MRALLACDTGGTKCDTLLVSADGAIVGTGSYSVRGDSGRSHKAVYAAIKAALSTTVFEELHIVCPREQLPDEVFDLVRADWLGLYAVSEHEAALAVAGFEHGGVVLAGTGSFVYVRTREGRELRVDGLGPLLGDEGSGFHIGYLALKAAIKADWHPRHATVLRDRIYSIYGVSDPYHFLYLDLFRRDRSEIAFFARLADEAAEQGDAVAQRVLRQAAGAIAENLCDLLDRYHIHEPDYPVVGVGSVVMKSRTYWEEFCKHVHRVAPFCQLMRAPLPLVVGVTRLGLRRAGFPNQAAADARFMAAATEYYRK